MVLEVVEFHKKLGHLVLQLVECWRFVVDISDCDGYICSGSC